MRIRTLELHLEFDDFTSDQPEDRVWGDTTFLSTNKWSYGAMFGKDGQTYITIEEFANPTRYGWVILDVNLGRVNYTEWLPGKHMRLRVAYERAIVEIHFPKKH
jgi:hypothetical protein